MEPEKIVSQICSRRWHYLTKDIDDAAILSIYHHVDSVLQDGPKCGLVALCMTSQLYNSQKQLKMEEVFKYAREKQFTNVGEMFSVFDMATLAEDLLSVQAKVLQNLSGNLETLLAHLCHGWPVLVPYDADGNHEPCLHNGHSAHWAVITGFCIVCSHQRLHNLPQVQEDVFQPHLFHALPYFGFSHVLKILHQDSKKQVFLYARQGKSRHLGVWKFEDLCASNCNLFELKPKFQMDDAPKFILREGSVSKGLNNKYVFIYPRF